MGFFDWVMKGIGFESEEDEDDVVQKSNEESFEKPTKKSRKELKEEKNRAKQMAKYEKKYGKESYSQSTPMLRDEKPTSMDSYSSPMFSASQSFGGGGTQQSSGFGDGLPTSVGGYGSKNFVFFKPKTYDDVTNLVEFMRQGEPAIINLDDISSEEAQRTLDFISGAVCALQGNIKRVTGNIFLIAPDGYNITKSE